MFYQLVHRCADIGIFVHFPELLLSADFEWRVSGGQMEEFDHHRVSADDRRLSQHSWYRPELKISGGRKQEKCNQ
jgi:hypothetical protein